jgi:hypothetical protein
MAYQLLTSMQLMENHIPADVLDGSSGFRAFQSQTGGFLLAIGSDSIFRAAVETPGSNSGWNVVDLNGDLTAAVQ